MRPRQICLEEFFLLLLQGKVEKGGRVRYQSDTMGGVPLFWGVNDGPSSDNKSKAFFIWNENLKWLHFDHFCQIENSNVEVFRYNFRLSADESGPYTCFEVCVQFIHWLHSSKTLDLNVNWESFNHFFLFQHCCPFLQSQFRIWLRRHVSQSCVQFTHWLHRTHFH